MSFTKSKICLNIDKTTKIPITNLFYDYNNDDNNNNACAHKQFFKLIKNLKNNNIDYISSNNNKNLIFSDALQVRQALELCFLPPRGVLPPTCKGDHNEYRDDHDDDRGAPPCIPCC